MKNIIWNGWVAGSLLFFVSCSSLPEKGRNQAFDDECNRVKSCIKDMDREFSSLEAHPAAYYEQLVSQLICRLETEKGVNPSRVDSLRRVSEDAQERFYKQMGFKWMELLDEEEKLMEIGKHVIPMRLYKGDEVQVKLSGSTAFKSVSLKDERTGEVFHNHIVPIIECVSQIERDAPLVFPRLDTFHVFEYESFDVSILLSDDDVEESFHNPFVSKTSFESEIGT